MPRNWIYVETISLFGQGYDLYESEDGKYCKQVWYDGVEEIYETA